MGTSGSGCSGEIKAEQVLLPCGKHAKLPLGISSFSVPLSKGRSCLPGGCADWRGCGTAGGTEGAPGSFIKALLRLSGGCTSRSRCL